MSPAAVWLFRETISGIPRIQLRDLFQDVELMTNLADAFRVPQSKKGWGHEFLQL